MPRRKFLYQDSLATFPDMDEVSVTESARSQHRMLPELRNRNQAPTERPKPPALLCASTLASLCARQLSARSCCGIPIPCLWTESPTYCKHTRSMALYRYIYIYITYYHLYMHILYRRLIIEFSRHTTLSFPTRTLPTLCRRLLCVEGGPAHVERGAAHGAGALRCGGAAGAAGGRAQRAGGQLKLGAASRQVPFLHCTAGVTAPHLAADCTSLSASTDGVN